MHYPYANSKQISWWWECCSGGQGRTKWICPTPLGHSYIQGTKLLFYSKQSKVNFSWEAQMAIRFTAIEKGTAFLKELNYDDI